MPQRIALRVRGGDAGHGLVDPALHLRRGARRVAELRGEVCERLHIARRGAPIDPGRTVERLDALPAPQYFGNLPRPIGRAAVVAAQIEHDARLGGDRGAIRSEEHTSELQSLMRISYAL